MSLLSKLESQYTKVVAILMPLLEIKRHTIPHLKALTRSIDHISWQECESANSSAVNTVLKNAILLHKMAK